MTHGLSRLVVRQKRRKTTLCDQDLDVITPLNLKISQMNGQHEYGIHILYHMRVQAIQDDWIRYWEKWTENILETKTRPLSI